MRLITRIRDAVVARLRAMRSRSRLFDRAAATYSAYAAAGRDRDAAALSYYAFLSVFPMLLIAVAVLGFLVRDPGTARSAVFRVVGDVIPGSDEFLAGSIDAIGRRATAIGAVALAWLAYSALGAVDVLRRALDRVFGVEHAGWVGAKLRNLRFAASSGLLLAVSVGLSTMTAWGLNAIMVRAGIDAALVRAAATAAAVGVAFLGDLLLFTLLFWQLPEHRLGWRDVVSGAAVGAIGFGAVKHIGGVVLAAGAARASAAYGLAAGVFGLLAVINISARLTLLAATWAAVAHREPDG